MLKACSKMKKKISEIDHHQNHHKENQKQKYTQ